MDVLKSLHSQIEFAQFSQPFWQKSFTEFSVKTIELIFVKILSNDSCVIFE